MRVFVGRVSAFCVCNAGSVNSSVRLSFERSHTSSVCRDKVGKGTGGLSISTGTGVSSSWQDKNHLRAEEGSTGRERQAGFAIRQGAI